MDKSPQKMFPLSSFENSMSTLHIRILPEYTWGWRSYDGSVANLLDSDIVACEFELQTCYYAYFQTNTLEKDTNLIYPLTMC